MQFVYFSIPLIGGYFIMSYAISQSDLKWSSKKPLPSKKEPLNVVDGVRIGEGGYGGGVKLAESCGEEQVHIRKRLEEMLRMERRKKERNEKD